MSENLSVVTGAKGYLGYALVNELTSRGQRLRLALHNATHDLDKFDCEKSYGDVCNIDFLKTVFNGADTVYHVAGVVDITGKRDKLVWDVNYDGTKAVVEACKYCGVKTLVYVSSVDCIHVTDDMQPIREFDHFDPDTIEGAYGKSKAAASQFVIDSNSDKLKCVVVQPSCIIGPDDYYHSSSICTMIDLYNKGLFVVSLGFGAYNFVDVRDVANGMIAAAEKGRGGQSYFLCGAKTSVDEFICYLAKGNDKKPPKVKLGKKFLLSATPAIAQVFKINHWPPVLTKFSINKICENCNFSYEKAQTELGYSPRDVGQSICDTAAWLKEHPKIK